MRSTSEYFVESCWSFDVVKFSQHALPCLPNSRLVGFSLLHTRFKVEDPVLRIAVSLRTDLRDGEKENLCKARIQASGNRWRQQFVSDVMLKDMYATISIRGFEAKI